MKRITPGTKVPKTADSLPWGERPFGQESAGKGEDQTGNHADKFPKGEEFDGVQEFLR